MWSEHTNKHLAFASAVNGGVTVAVRIFNVHAALIEVTKDASLYLTGAAPQNKLRFLTIEPSTGVLKDVPLAEEIGRIALTLIDHARGSFT